jgi:hypothetical protein
VPVITALFLGLKAAVLAIVLHVVHRVGSRALKSRPMLVLAALAFIGIFFPATPFPLIVIAAGVIGFISALRGSSAFQVCGDDDGGRKGAPDEGLLGAELPEHARPTLQGQVRSGAGWAQAGLRAEAARKRHPTGSFATGTDGSTPSPSSAESIANLVSGAHGIAANAPARLRRGDRNARVPLAGIRSQGAASAPRAPANPRIDPVRIVVFRPTDDRNPDRQSNGLHSRANRNNKPQPTKSVMGDRLHGMARRAGEIG